MVRYTQCSYKFRSWKAWVHPRSHISSFSKDRYFTKAAETQSDEGISNFWYGFGMKEAEALRRGMIGILPTDTLYGIVASALNEESVRRVYTLKERTPTKPCIILIPSLEDVAAFGVVLSKKRREVLAQYWPGPVSISMPCGPGIPEYLHRGTGTLAFRVPNDERLVSFLRCSGPLIAPSANPEGLKPAETIDEAKKYFGTRVDFYIDDGVRAGMPSKLIALDEHDSVTILRDTVAPK